MKDGREAIDARVRALEERLVRVEAANGRYKRTGLAACVVVSSLLLMGIGPGARVPDVLSARSFELVDDAGTVRGVWAVRGDEGIAMVLLDDAGATTTALQMTAGKPYLALLGGNGEDGSPGSGGRRLFSWGEPEGQPAEGGDWPSWGGDPDEKRGDGPDFDWDLN